MCTHIRHRGDRVFSSAFRLLLSDFRLLLILGSPLIRTAESFEIWSPTWATFQNHVMFLFDDSFLIFTVLSVDPSYNSYKSHALL